MVTITEIVSKKKNARSRRRTTAPSRSTALVVRTRVAKRTGRKSLGAGGKKMDSAARNYAALLANPCTATLAKVPATGNSGFVLRAETDVIFGSGGTDTSGYVSWTPNALSQDGSLGGGVNATGLLIGGAPSSATATAPVYNANVPALAYLRANASGYRCVAACIQVFWPGSELNRQGIISMCNAPQNMVRGPATGFAGTAISADSIRSSSQVVSRMPTDHLELVWRPGDLDYIYRDPLSSFTGDGNNALVVSWAGLPVSTGLRFRFVAVWEWVPYPVNGFVPSLQESTNSSWSPGQIRAWLDSHFPNWTYHVDPRSRDGLLGRILQLAGIVNYGQMRTGAQIGN